MNYLDVIIQGYCHDNNRKHLADYFYRQIETAVKGKYSAKEFYDGCLLVLQQWETLMNISLIDRQNMLSLMIDRANNGEADLSVLDKKPISKKGYIKQLETELNTITVQNYPAQLSTLTKHKATGVIYYDGIQYIKDALKKAYKRTLFIYDDFGELFRYAVRYELISGIEVTQVGTESYLLKLNTYNFEFNRWLQEIKGWDYGNEKQYNEYLNKETFKEFLKYRQKQEQQRQNEIEAEKESWAIETPQQTETKTKQETPTFTNNFDNIKPNEIYKHFKAGLVEKGYLTEQELNEYLKAAFELKTIPETLFKLKHIPTKQKIYTVFYIYYKDISQKKHERQKEYAALLGDYFEGYKTKIIQTNWARDYKTKR